MTGLNQTAEGVRSRSGIRGLEGLGKNLTAFVDRLDLSFGMIAQKLPDIQRHTSDLFQVLAVIETGANHHSIAADYAELDEVTSQMLHALDESSENAQRIVEWLLEVEAPLARVLEELSEVITTCTDLTLLSINAKLLANDSRKEDGDTFGVITQELNSAAQEMSSVAASLKDAVTSIKAQTEEARRLKEMLKTIVELHVLDLRSKIDEARKSCHDTLTKVQTTFDLAKGQCASVEPRIGKLMLTLQQQDILRQGLEHISVVLEEILACQYAIAGNPLDTNDEGEIQTAAEELDFVRQASALSRRLCEENKLALNRFFSTVDEDTALLGDIGTNIEKLDSNLGTRDEIVKEVLRPAEMVVSATETLGALESIVSDAAERIDSVTSSLQVLRRRLDEMERMSKDLSVIENGMRIKTAKSYGLRSDAGLLADEIKDKNLDLAERVDQAQDIVTELSKSGRRLAKRSCAVREGAGAHWGHIARGLSSELRIVSSEFADVLKETIAIGTQARASTESFHEELNRIQDDRDATDQMGIVLEDVNDLVARRTMTIESSLGHPLPEVQCRRRLAELIERFTVLSQKEIARDVTAIEIEDGDPGGELTLF